MPQYPEFQVLVETDEATMKKENVFGQDLEKIYFTAITALEALRELCDEDDFQTASFAGMFLENAVRSGVNHLVNVAEEKPSALQFRAGVCLDWPGFLPEHKASREANNRMHASIGLGVNLNSKMKGLDLGSRVQEIVSAFYSELVEAKLMYHFHLEREGVDSLPEWRHEAANLPPLPGSSDCREAWFRCAWAAFNHSLEVQNVSLEKNEYIRAIGIPGAQKKAYNRKQQKLKRLRAKLREEQELLAKVTLKGLENGLKRETAELNPIEDQIENLEREELNIFDSEIVERARSSIRDAFLIRLDT